LVNATQDGNPPERNPEFGAIRARLRLSSTRINDSVFVIDEKIITISLGNIAGISLAQLLL
jgi:hypothetical protein